MDERPSGIADLSRDNLIRLVGIFLGEVIVHYGLWFSHTVHHNDLDTGLELESKVLEEYGSTALTRLAPHLGIEMEGNMPKTLLAKSRDELVQLLQDIAKTWLTSDGLWFQQVEGRFDMQQAKVVNDSCWSLFARMEAFKIRRFLGLGSRGGLRALETALKFRIYSSINVYEAHWEDGNSLVWRMLQCRVQTARRGKGMADYPCRSAGIVEYTRFAQGIDRMIRTECIACPPDPVPEGIFCAWRFTMRG